MSSLAASRADNFYYGTEYGPKHGSLNKFRGSHGALGSRANRLHEGILIIRFEMPFKVWCNGCKCIVAKGVRFNAEKKCVGNYFTTKIYEFAMRCYHCPTIFKVVTDPKSCEYILADGLSRKVEAFDAKDAQTIELIDREEREKMNADAMYRLEQVETQKTKVRDRLSNLAELKELQMDRSDSYAANGALRKRFRARKRLEVEDVKDRAKVGFFLNDAALTVADNEELAGYKQEAAALRRSKRARTTRKR